MEICYPANAARLGALLTISSLHPINTPDSIGSICSSKTVVISSPELRESEVRSAGMLFWTCHLLVSRWSFTIMAIFIVLCRESKPLISDRFDPHRVASLTTFVLAQLSRIHHVLWCKPIDLCFFRDQILDRLQAARFPSSPHLSSVSHKSMWCNCINSLSHSSGLEAEYSQRERKCFSVAS